MDVSPPHFNYNGHVTSSMCSNAAISIGDFRITCVVHTQYLPVSHPTERGGAGEISRTILLYCTRDFAQTSSTTSDPEGHWEMSNCRELLPGRLHVHWEVRDDWVQVQLTGKIREDQYMAFGLSGSQQR